jgi:hypothetical protein
MRSEHFGKIALTKKRFRLALAVLGLLAAWIVVLSGLVLTSSLASAEKRVEAKAGQAIAGASFNASALAPPRPAKGHSSSVSAPTSDLPAGCDRSPMQDRERWNCDQPFRNADLQVHSRTFPSVASTQSNGTSSAGRQRGMDMFSRQSGPLDSLGLFGSFSQLAPFTQVNPSFEPHGSVEPAVEVPDDMDDGASGNENRQDLSDDLAKAAQQLSDKMGGAIPDINFQNEAPGNYDALQGGTPLVTDGLSATESVPEPFTITLFAVGLLRVKLHRRRQVSETLSHADAQRDPPADKLQRLKAELFAFRRTCAHRPTGRAYSGVGTAKFLGQRASCFKSGVF